MPNRPEQPFPIILIYNVLKGPAHPVYHKTLNLKISVPRQNIENLISNFGAIYVGIMRAEFQTFSFTGVC